MGFFLSGNSILWPALGPVGAVYSSSTVEPLILFNNVILGYGSKVIFADLNFQVVAGDYMAIVGSNGSGKTTLLRALLGLLPPQSGEVDTPSGPVHFGYVPQVQALEDFFPLTLQEMVLMGRYGRLGPLRWPGKKDRDKVMETLEEVGLGQHGNRLFRELSGGQKQRALVARALVSEPDILVLDEHTNNLDIAGEKSIMEFIGEVHSAHNIAIVMVTHSLNAVANHAKHIGIIKDGKFLFQTMDGVMQTEYLTQFYGVPMRVLEVDGQRVIL